MFSRMILASLAGKALSTRSDEKTSMYDYYEDDMSESEGDVDLESLLEQGTLSIPKTPNCLGSGDFGVVYEVTWDKKPAAIKIIRGPNPEYENYALTRRIPGVLNCHFQWKQKNSRLVKKTFPKASDGSFKGELQFLILDQGECDLFSYMFRLKEDENGPREFIRCITDMLESYKQIHNRNMVHIDVKLSNFLRVKRRSAQGDYYKCMLMDLDRMRECDKTDQYSGVKYVELDDGLRIPDDQKFSPQYGPEFKRGSISRITVKQDIYAFGASLKFALQIIKNNQNEKGKVISKSRSVASFLKEFEGHLKNIIKLCQNPLPSARPTAAQLFTLLSKNGTDKKKLGVAIANLTGELLPEDF